jgi:hypothetical protein
VEHVEAPYELCILEGVSHWVPTREPEALADAILARVGAEQGARRPSSRT